MLMRNLCSGLLIAISVSLAGCSEAPTETTSTTSKAPPAPPNGMEEATLTISEPPVEDSVSVEIGSEAVDSATADEPDLFGPGSPAPPIAIGKWVKGDPVESFSNDKIYVVEFWATWCGPCLRSMPHMASLQTEYGDKVAFIGISDEDEATVNGFMKKKSQDDKTWEEVLTYTIALDDEQKTNSAYMKAANQNGIPCAFIVGKSGNVEWIGHPASMDDALEQIVAGSWDSAAARKEFIQETENERVMNEYMPRLAQAANSGDFAEALKVCDEILEKHPGNSQIAQIRMRLMIQGKMSKEYNIAAAKQVEENFDNAMLLNEVAWTIADGMTGEERDLDLAMKAAMRASELKKHSDAAILDTVARVFYEQQDLTKAIEWQKKAVEADGSMPELKETLSQYEAKASPSKEESTTTEQPASDEPAATEEPAK